MPADRCRPGRWSAPLPPTLPSPQGEVSEDRPQRGTRAGARPRRAGGSVRRVGESRLIGPERGGEEGGGAPWRGPARPRSSRGARRRDDRFSEPSPRTGRPGAFSRRLNGWLAGTTSSRPIGIGTEAGTSASRPSPPNIARRPTPARRPRPRAPAAERPGPRRATTVATARPAAAGAGPGPRAGARPGPRQRPPSAPPGPRPRPGPQGQNQGPPQTRPHGARPGWEGPAGFAQKVAREFSDGVRSRGQSYFAKNRVAITASSPGEVVARVKGTAKYRVRLRLRGDRLVATCSCPYFSPFGDACKHLWATILAADARGPPARRRRCRCARSGW